MKKARINFRIAEDKHKWLKKFAGKNKKTVTALFEEYVDRLIDQHGKSNGGSKLSIRN